MLKRLLLSPLLIALALLLAMPASAANPTSRLATTTSTTNSGLMDFLSAIFTAATGKAPLLLASRVNALLQYARGKGSIKQ